MSDRLYQGFPTRSVPDVRVIVGAPTPTPMVLNPRIDLKDYAVGHFDWGEQGPGACQLALAILADALRGFFAAKDARSRPYDPDQLALALHEAFEAEIICHLDPQASWAMSRNSVVAIVSGMLARTDTGRLIARIEGLGLPSNEDGLH